VAKNDKSALTQKEKMLGMALYARGVDKPTMLSIMMVLQSEDEQDDMAWYMGQNPQATQNQLLAVAYQIAKEAKEKKNG